MSSSYEPTPRREDTPAAGDRGDTTPEDRSYPREVSPEDLGRDRSSVVDREKERYGGVKIGSAFFGWLTATGTAVLLTALVAAAGTAVGVATNTDVGSATDAATDAATTDPGPSG